MGGGGGGGLCNDKMFPLIPQEVILSLQLGDKASIPFLIKACVYLFF